MQARYFYFQGCHKSEKNHTWKINGNPEIKIDLKFFIRMVNIMGNLNFVFQGSQKMEVRVIDLSKVRVPISWKATHGIF